MVLWERPLGILIGPAYPTFEFNLLIKKTYLCTKFCVNRIEIATPSVYTYKHTHTYIKVRYIILVYPNMAGLLISNTVFCCRIETLPYVGIYLVFYMFVVWLYIKNLNLNS